MTGWEQVRLGEEGRRRPRNLPSGAMQGVGGATSALCGEPVEASQTTMPCSSLGFKSEPNWQARNEDSPFKPRGTFPAPSIHFCGMTTDTGTAFRSPFPLSGHPSKVSSICTRMRTAGQHSPFLIWRAYVNVPFPLWTLRTAGGQWLSYSSHPQPTAESDAFRHRKSTIRWYWLWIQISDSFHSREKIERFKEVNQNHILI